MLDDAGAKEQAKADDLSPTRNDGHRGTNETVVRRKLEQVPLSRVGSSYTETLTENVADRALRAIRHAVSEDSANTIGRCVTH